MASSVSLALLFLLAAIVCCYGQLNIGTCDCGDRACRGSQSQGPNRPCCVYRDRPYQNTTASLSDPNGTPLGFSSDVLPRVESSEPRPCVAVPFGNPQLGSVNYISVVMQSLLSGQRVCAQQEDGEDSAACTEGILGHFCGLANIRDGNAYIEFVCTGSCENSDFSFYYKIETASLSTDDEFWCNTRDLSIPLSLIIANPSLNPVTPDLTDATSPPSSSQALTFFAPILLLSLLVGRLLMS